MSQIDAGNFSQLKVAWIWCSPDELAIAEDADLWPGHHEVTPLMVDGVLYTSTSLSQAAAVDPLTGATLWRYDPRSYVSGPPPNQGHISRGLSFWADGTDKRVILTTGDGRLIALSAYTGLPIPDFGDNGTVDLKLGLRRSVDSAHYGSSSPALVCGNTLVVGSNVLDWPAAEVMPPGDVRGFDARSGALKWTFNTIPQAGEPGNDTWENDSWVNTGSANVWINMSCDPALGLVYLPTSTPTNDYFGGGRLGDNLHAESVVALDVETGARAWSFQTVHHGLWDYDLPAAPVLADVVVAGKPVPVLAQVSKQAFTYVFDRRDGTPVWPINETAVPVDTDVPGERPAATQPIPTRPAPFDRQGFSENDLIDFTPALREAALARIQGLDMGPLYSPPTQKGRLSMPGMIGGASWAGAGVHPATGIMYVPSVTRPGLLKVVDLGLQTTPYVGTPTFAFGPEGLPLVKPPYARVTAIDLNSGDHVWMTPIGEGLEEHPALAGLNLSGLGYPTRPFVLVTDSLLFVAQEGNTTSRKAAARGNSDVFTIESYRPSLRAYRLDTGELVGQVPLPANANGSLMGYMVNGRQFIVVPVGGSGMPASHVALALPE